MVAIGVVTAALVVVLSVFNGFEDMVKDMYGDFYADLQITAEKGKWLNISGEKLTQLKAVDGVAFVQPVIMERAILLDQEDKSIVWLKGVSEHYANFSGVPNHMLRGNFFVGDSASPRLVLGFGVEQSLQIIAGQSPMPVTVYLPNPDAGPAADVTTAMVSANAFSAGTFAVQQEFDEQYAFTHASFLSYMLGLPQNQFTSIELFVKDRENTGNLQDEVLKIMGAGFNVKDRFQQNQALFSAMKTEKLIIYAISFLILVIAGFNIVSSLTMTVIEKQKDIAVLKAMGTSDETVRRIFLQLGILLAGIGAMAGFVLGVLICLGQQQFHWVKLGGQSFIIDYYPVAVRLADLLVVVGIVVFIAIIAAWLPAKRATMSYFSLR